MGILERFRTQPRWKHADPAVRVAAVYEAGPDEADALRALAREDTEARVRRAAVSRLADVGLLADVARTDPDEDVRAEALRGLAGIAVETVDLDVARDVFGHLTALGRAKEIVVAARESGQAGVRLAAVESLSEPKSLGSVSRHARDAVTRLAALARLTDDDEVLSVALRSEYTDVAVAALDRIASAERLGTVSQRARNKVAARRARTRLREFESPAAATPEAAGSRMTVEHREQAQSLLTRIEALVSMADPDEGAAALATTRYAWAELQADVEVDPEWISRIDAAIEAAREAVVEREEERKADQVRAEELAREHAGRLAIVEEIEQLSGPAGPDRIAELKVAWDALPPTSSDYAASLARRFQDACRTFEDRERRRTLAEAAAARLDTLSHELAQLAASDQPVEEVVARWRGLRRDAEVLRHHAEANPAAAHRLEEAVATLEEREHAVQGLRAKQEQDNLRRLHQVCRHADALLASDALTLRAADRALREVRAALESRAPVPSKQDRQEVQQRLESARARLAPKVQELRDADEWQRWANVQVQEELCREMEALVTTSDLDLAARRMRELQARWRPVALAPRAQGETLWRRFKAAQDQVFVRTAEHVAAQQEQRRANLARKLALIERAEALADSSDWARTAAALQALQAEWKAVGPVNRGHEKSTWERFRGACDRFFTRRQEDLKRRKDDWSANLAKKEALCAAAEALAESSDWDRAAGELKQLQASWKTIGPVRKAKSEAVWQRFRSACDRFFDRFKHRDELELQQKVGVRDAIIRRLEILLPEAGAGVPPAPTGLVGTLQEVRASWQQAPELPRGVQQDLAARYLQVIGRVVATWPTAFAGTDLDPDATRRRMEKLVTRLEELVAAQPRRQVHLSPAELLAQQWRDRLAANTISGGKAEEDEEQRWRAAEQEVRSAQAQWARLGPVPPEIAGPLNERFQRACRRFSDQRRRAS
jgi:hypothetical protein